MSETGGRGTMISVANGQGQGGNAPLILVQDGNSQYWCDTWPSLADTNIDNPSNVYTNAYVDYETTSEEYTHDGVTLPLVTTLMSQVGELDEEGENYNYASGTSGTADNGNPYNYINDTDGATVGVFEHNPTYCDQATGTSSFANRIITVHTTDTSVVIAGTNYTVYTAQWWGS